MKIRNVSLVALALVTSCILSAQDCDSVNFNNSKKHEIGINILPVFGLYSDDNSGSIIFPFYLSYKFKMSDSKLRLNYSSNENRIEGMKGGYTVSDTIRVLSSTDRSEQTHRLGIGLEHNKTTKWIEWIFAVDMTFGYHSTDTYLSTQSFEVNADDEYRPIGIGFESEHLHSNTYYSFGLAPTLGFNTRISKSFTFGVLLPLNFSYAIADGSNSSSFTSNYFNYEPNLHLMLNFQF